MITLTNAQCAIVAVDNSADVALPNLVAVNVQFGYCTCSTQGHVIPSAQCYIGTEVTIVHIIDIEVVGFQSWTEQDTIGVCANFKQCTVISSVDLVHPALNSEVTAKLELSACTCHSEIVTRAVKVEAGTCEEAAACVAAAKSAFWGKTVQVIKDLLSRTCSVPDSYTCNKAIKVLSTCGATSTNEHVFAIISWITANGLKVLIDLLSCYWTINHFKNLSSTVNVNSHCGATHCQRHMCCCF